MQKIEGFSEQKKNWRVGSEEHVKWIENPPYSQAKLNADSKKKLIEKMLQKDHFKFKALENPGEVIRKGQSYSSIELLQNTTHNHIAVRNFSKNLSLIQKSTKASFQIDLKQQLIEIGKSRA